ncbi:LCP family protein [Berryella wangjianweii]|uniref:LCP family protein n=1 Tax=Berryella wangjianweii TaxID=2734634 RepID=A0A6M8J7U7_9ACTN|nr:LCP family protein [Berryella wangjianweii]QKF07628.1 LCP family protein [Berryella wangjianweii]
MGRGKGDSRSDRGQHGAPAGSHAAGEGQPAFKAAYEFDQKSAAVPRSVREAAEAYSRDSEQYSSRRKGGVGRKVAIGVLSTMLVLILGGAAWAAVYIANLDTTLSGNKTTEELDAINEVLTAKSALDKPFYVMLLGSDKREGSAEQGERTDTNILVRVDPTTNTINMMSIPRDTAINYEGQGTVKFNAAYTFGGTAGSIKQAAELTGAEIAYYAEISFTGLINLVDAVGGVDVQVDERIDDPDAGPVVIEEGMQHLNGEAALVFARSRAYGDGDYTRVSNQRKLIEAVIKKVQAMPITDIPGIVQEGAKSVSTNLRVTDLVALALEMRDKGPLTIHSSTVPSLPHHYQGLSYVFADYDALRQMMEAINAGKDASLIATTKTKEQLVAEYEQRAFGRPAPQAGQNAGAGQGTWNGGGGGGVAPAPATGAGNGGGNRGGTYEAPAAGGAGNGNAAGAPGAPSANGV